MNPKFLVLKKRIQALLNPNKNEYQREREAARYIMISRPTSGRTWLRVMIGRVFQEISGLKTINPQNLYYLSELNSALPSIKPVHELFIFKNQEDYRNKKVILLTRDPRDALVSNWHKKQKINKQWKASSLSDFLRNSDYLDKMIELYNFWIENRDVPEDFLRVRYEDMVGNPGGELKRVMNFLGLQVSERAIAAAVEYASLDNMKKLVAGGDKQPGKVGELYKIRQGKTGTYKEKLSTEDLAFIEQQLQERLHPSYEYNYLT